MRRFLSRAADRAAELLLRRIALAERTSPAVKIALRARYDAVRAAALTGGPLPHPRTAGFRIFSQADEDGVLLLLLATIGIGPGRCVDIGGGDGLIASNTANLVLNLGFDGALIDADERAIERGRRFYARHPDAALYPPRFIEALVTRENVNQLLVRAGMEGEVDVLSIDIDGNDYWIWEAITAVRPRIVVVEAQVERGMRDEVMPYQAAFSAAGAARGSLVGATVPALVRLGAQLGYRLVAANRYGFNLFFVRNDLAPELLPALEPASVLDHPRTRARAAQG